MKLSLLFVFLIGCGNDPSSQPSDAAPPPTHTPDGGLCCQIINNDSTDPYWNNKRWACGDNLPNNFPWVCNYDTDAATCQDEACTTGSTCFGVGGTGIVLDCNSEDWSDW